MKIQGGFCLKLICSGIFLVGGLSAITVSSPTTGYAQETISSVGIAGRDDKLQRSPALSVRVVPGTDTTKILIDANERNKEYLLYPMQFDIYINRRLFSSQYRSNTLPGPIGVDVGSDIATLPFNYTIIAKVLTPNGNPFTSVLEGAAFASSLSGLLDCTVSFGSGTTSEFVENNVQIKQIGNSSVRVDISNANGIGTDDTLDATLTASVTGTAVSGTLVTTTNNLGSSQRTETVDGNASNGSNGALTSLSVANADGSVSVSCL